MVARFDIQNNVASGSRKSREEASNSIGLQLSYSRAGIAVVHAQLHVMMDNQLIY